MSEETVDGRAVETVEIAAPPERVFDALTDPREVAEWRRGGARELTVVDPPRRVEHTWRPGREGPADTVRYDLEPATVDGAPGTRVTVTHERGGSLAPFTMRCGRPAWARRRATARR